MIYYFHNEFHLGDNVFNLIFFNNLKNYLVINNIKIKYYCQPTYFNQLLEFIDNNKNVTIYPISEKPSNSLQLWIENTDLEYTFSRVKEININNGRQKLHYNTFYKNFFNVILSRLNILFKFKSFYYDDPELLTIYNNLNEKYKNADILVVNSQPLSDQYNYNKLEWDNYICELNKKYKIVTTTHVNNETTCTMDDNLTIKTIAAISTNVSVIIAINSGVVPGLLNKYTLKNVKQFYTFDDRSCYSYPNFVSREKITDISFDELDKFIVKKPKSTQIHNQAKFVSKNIITNEILSSEDEELKKKYLSFDYEVYLYFNKDLLIDTNNPNAKSEAWKHFINHGINENRVYSFDWMTYINENNLISIINNKNDAFKHMIENNKFKHYTDNNDDDNNIQYGLFDWEYYVKNNNDLLNITNHDQAFSHYLNHGKFENRKISDFDWMDYLLLNKDLIEQGYVTEIKAIKHWVKHGKNENRPYKMDSL